MTGYAIPKLENPVTDEKPPRPASAVGLTAVLDCVDVQGGGVLHGKTRD